MFKKILTVVGFIGLVAILIMGGILRTRTVTGATGITESTSETNLAVNPISEIVSSELITIEGVVQNQDDESLTILSDTAESILIDGRSFRYLSENSIQINVGDRVSLSGFYGNGTFEVSKITNLTSGGALMLRGADGHPAWAGGEQ